MALTSNLSVLNQYPATPSTYGTPGTLQSGAATVGGNLQAFLGSNSPLMQDAARRGMETAATRGGVNSSIAAGAAQRASLDTASNLAEQATAIDQNRENVQSQNWLNQQNFSRALQGQFATSSFDNAQSMLQMIQQYSLNDPELYTPEVVSGYSNFFSQNANDILSRYLGG